MALDYQSALAALKKRAKREERDNTRADGADTSDLSASQSRNVEKNTSAMSAISVRRRRFSSTTTSRDRFSTSEPSNNAPEKKRASLRTVADKSDTFDGVETKATTASDYSREPPPARANQAPLSRPRFPPGVQLDADGIPTFDTGQDHLLGDGIVVQDVRNQRMAMQAQAERALERAAAAVNPALADDPGEVWLRGEVDE